MRCIGVKALKNKLSEYLRIVGSGETVLITDRDRVIAELIPPREGRSLNHSDAQLADAVRQGWLTPAMISSGPPPPRLPVDRMANILGQLEADRAER